MEEELSLSTIPEIGDNTDHCHSKRSFFRSNWLSNSYDSNYLFIHTFGLQCLLASQPRSTVSHNPTYAEPSENPCQLIRPRSPSYHVPLIRLCPLSMPPLSYPNREQPKRLITELRNETNFRASLLPISGDGCELKSPSQ